MGRLKFDMTGDNSAVLKAFLGIQNGVRQTSQIVEQQGQSIENVFNRIKSVASVAFAGFTAKEIVSTLATVRGDFQQFEIAFETMLGSASKAKTMIADLANLAATTPFDMKGVVSGAKQLLAYGFAAEDITETMRRLGDVSAGLGLNLQDLTWLYGTTMVQGRLFTRDLMQFTSRGIPLTEELAKQFGVTKDKVAELVTAGKIGFPEVKAAIDSLTNEGGKFGGLMEKQSKSITGQISNIEDTIEMAINDLGTQTEGLMNDALDITSTIIDHWQDIGEAILAAASAIGLYKAMAVSIAAFDIATSNVGYAAELSALNDLLPAKEQAKKTDLEEAVAKGQLSASQAELIASKREEAKAYVESLAEKAKSAQEELTNINEEVDALKNRDREAQLSLDYYEEQYKAALKTGDGIAIETAENNLNTAAAEKNATAKKLQSAQDKQAAAAKAADAATTEANTAAQGLNTSATERGTAAKGVHAQFTLLCKKAQDAWNASMFASPLFWIAAAIAAATYAVYKLVTAETDHEKAIRASNEAWDEFDKKVQERQSNIESLIRTIQSETASEYEKAEAYQKLTMIAPELTEKYSQAQLASADFAKTQKEVGESFAEDKYQKAKEDVDELRKKIEETTVKLNQYKNANFNDPDYFRLFSDNASLNNKLDVALDKLVEIENVRDRVVENEKPIKIRIEEAKENVEVRQKIFDFYDEAMVLANDWQAANETINFATGETRFDAFISKIQKDLNLLRKRMAENPLDAKLRLEEQEKQKILDGILSMKDSWKNNGSLFIPLQFRADWDSAKSALDNAKSKLSGFTKEETTTYAQSFNAAKKAYETAQKRLADIIGNKSKYTEKEYNDAANDAKATKDAYAKLGGDPDGKKAKAYANAQKNRAKEEDKEKKAQEELNQKLKSLQQQNNDTEISLMKEGSEKKLKEIDNDYKKRIAEIDKQETEFKKKNKETGKKGALTKDQSDALQKSRDLAKQNRDKQTSEVYKEDLSAMRDYLKEYGTLYQQKQALAEEYEEKIANASTKWEKMSLEEEKKKSINDLEIEVVKQNIDWGSVFGNFGAMFKDQLQPTIEQLNELSRSTTDVNEQKTIQELISKLQSANTVWDSDIFKKVSDDIVAYQNAMNGFTEAQEREKSAAIDVANAQLALADAQKNDPLNIETYQAALDAAKANLVNASSDVKTFGIQVSEASENVKTSAEKAKDQFSQLETGLQGLTSGSLKGVGNAILSLDKLFGGDMQKDVANIIAKGTQSLFGKNSKASKAITEALGNAGLAGDIISAVLGLLDILKEGIGGLVSSLIDTVLGAVSGIVNDIFSGDIILKPLNSLYNNISSILNSVTFGGLNHWLEDSWFSDNTAKMQDSIDALTQKNDVLAQCIDDLTDTIQNSSLYNAQNAYDTAVALTKQEETNAQDAMYKEAEKHGRFRVSLNKSVEDNKGWKEAMAAASEALGKSISTSSDFLHLTATEMAKIRDYDNGETLSKILEEYRQEGGKNGKSGNIPSMVLEYISKYEDAYEDLAEQLSERYTGLTFDTLKDDFKSALKDMDKSAEDFAEDFSQYLFDAVIDAKIGDLLDKDLKDFYDEWDKRAQASGGKLSTDDVDVLNKMYSDIVDKGLEYRNEASKITGYTGSSSQSATSGTWESMGQDTADELNGRFTALQVAGENIAQNMSDAVSQMQSIVTLGISTNGAVLEIRNMMIMTNSYLEDVVKYAKLTYTDFGSKLDDMNKRLKEI